MKKQRAYGSKLSYSLDSGVTYTQVTDMRLITPPKEGRGDGDITHLESPNEGNEQMPGGQKTSDIKCEALYNQARYTTLRNLQKTLNANYNSDAATLWKIEAPVAYGQTTRAKMITPGYLGEVMTKELKNEDNPMVIEFTIKEADCSRAWTEGA